MAAGDERAAQIYQTIGTYLGYAIAHYADFYEIRHLLILGRVTTGAGGQSFSRWPGRYCGDEFPELAGRLALHTPDETEKRHGQAMAAALARSVGADVRKRRRKAGQRESEKAGRLVVQPLGCP